MTPRVLRAHIAPLPENPPQYRKLETAIQIGAGFDGAWYRSQKEHWLGWLREYDGPGAYGRGTSTPRRASYVWTHIQCAPMLFWLAEALDAPQATLNVAFEAVINAPGKGASQCAALRKILLWSDIDALLNAWPYSRTQQLRIRWARIRSTEKP